MKIKVKSNLFQFQNGDGKSAKGKWTLDKKNFKEISKDDCKAVTHSNNKDKTKAKFTFKADKAEKDVKFKLIIVKDKETYWTDIDV